MLKRSICIIGIIFLIIIAFNGICFSAINDGLVAYYPFSGNADDESGNGSHGTVYGATLVADRFGNPNSAYQFDGVDDVIDSGNSSYFNFGTGFTFTGWIKVSEFNGASIFMKKKKNYENKYLKLYNQRLMFYLYYTTGESTTGSGSLPLNQWVHVAATYDGSFTKTYINGVFSVSRSATGDVADSTANMYIGRSNQEIDPLSGGPSFKGMIDDVRFYNRALSESEIESLVTGTVIDTDGDGIIDMWDLCPATPVESVIDSDGCPAKNKVAVIPLETIYNKTIPRTGQTTCYENNGSVVSCSSTGQDGEKQSGEPFPAPRFTDHQNGTVTDRLTDLMWTKNANLLNGVGGFQWALDYVAGMKAGSYENYGYTDWRVPNIRELMSLIDYERYKPVLTTGHPFTDVQGTHNNLYYHTSTTHTANYTHTYCVSFYHADVTGCNKYEGNNDAYLWPVRGGK
jgi:hypothetical protein